MSTQCEYDYIDNDEIDDCDDYSDGLVDDYQDTE